MEAPPTATVGVDDVPRGGWSRRRFVAAGAAAGVVVAGGGAGVASAARSAGGALRRSAWTPHVGRAVRATRDGRALQLRLVAVEDVVGTGSALHDALADREDSFVLRFASPSALADGIARLTLPGEEPVDLLLVDGGRRAGRPQATATVLGAPARTLEADR